MTVCAQAGSDKGGEDFRYSSLGGREVGMLEWQQVEQWLNIAERRLRPVILLGNETVCLKGSSDGDGDGDVGSRGKRLHLLFCLVFCRCGGVFAATFYCCGLQHGSLAVD